MKKVKLSEIGKIITGCTPSTKKEEYYSNNDFMFVGPSDIKSVMYVDSTEKHISIVAFNDYKNRFINENSIVVDCIGSDMGNVAIIKNKCLTNQQINAITDINSNDYNIKYIYYVLSTMKQYFHLIGTNGSTMPILNKKMFENVEIEVQEKEIQDKIANILSKLDDKIKLNNEINNNLHELLKVIYDGWFEKYKYPNSNQNKHINWKKDRLGNYLKVERGLSYKGKFLSEEGTPMVNLGNIMPNGVFRIEKNKYYTGDYKEKVTVNVGDIVVANTDMTQNRDVLGTPVIIPPIYEDKIIYSHHIYGLKNLKLPKLFVFYSLLKPKFRNLAGGSATGTTVLALQKEVIEDYAIVIPDEETLNSFTKLAEKIQKRRENIILENIKLEQLRDTLLPKLMNGEFDLDNIEI